MNMKEKRTIYDLKFKQSVIKYAEENSNSEAGRNQRQIFLSKQKEKIVWWRAETFSWKPSFFFNYSIPDFN